MKNIIDIQVQYETKTAKEMFFFVYDEDTNRDFIINLLSSMVENNTNFHKEILTHDYVSYDKQTKTYKYSY